MSTLIKPLNDSVSPQLPGRLSELTSGTAVDVKEARKSPGTAEITLSHASTKDLKFFVRWLSLYGDELIVLVEESNRTIDPDEVLAAQTILRVVDRKTLSLVDKAEFPSMLLIMVDDIKISSALPAAAWNARLESDITKAFDC